MNRREFGRLTLAGLPAAALLETPLFGSALLQAKPNSLFKGVQIGTITYSFRSMPDQSAEATLKYTVDSGISAIELMGGRGAQPQLFQVKAGMMTGPGNNQPTGQWNGDSCPAPRGGGAGGGRGAEAPAAAAGGAAAAGAPPAPPAGGGGGGGRGGPQTPEQIAATDAERKWRMGLSMDIFKDLRKMYNDAGVSIYAVKDVRQGTDEDLEYTFTVAKTLGANHVTLELPAGANAAATLKKLGDTALKHQMFVAYHTHLQGSMTCFDEAFAISKGNMANVDLGHFVAATNPQGTPLDFLNKHHARISSFHLKDRTTAAHCGLNLAWGTGETPIKEILQLVSRNSWKIPASIELEYQIPQGSDAVLEVRKCVEYCKAALGA